MAEEQVFQLLKNYNNKKEKTFPGINLARVDHQQRIEQIEENKDDEYEYQNYNVEDIFMTSLIMMKILISKN